MEGFLRGVPCFSPTLLPDAVSSSSSHFLKESEVSLPLWECVINIGGMGGRVPGSYSWLWPHSGMCPEVK